MDQQQQQHQQEQQQSFQIAPPPPSQITTEYANFSIANSSQMPPASGTTTFVTIGILPPSQQQMIPTLASHSQSSACGTTSTFKTPLLPMPSLDDIEGTIMPTLVNQQQQQQQQQPIPGGILKYPSCNSSSFNLPIGLDTGPHLPISQASQGIQQINDEQQQLPLAYQSNILSTKATTPTVAPLSMQLPPNSLVLNDATSCGTLKSSAKLLPQAMASSGGVNPSSPQPLISDINSGGGIGSGKCTVKTPISSSMAGGIAGVGLVTGTMTSSGSIPTASTTTNLNKMHNIGSSINNLRHKSSTTTVNSSITGNNSTKTKTRTKCCTCFGTQSSETSSNSKSKNRKQKHQTMWSALLTNLGICALLLAYTLLGSFIFLTIESEDSIHQHTLASTKRGVGLGGRLTTMTMVGGNMNNFYQNQHQQQLNQHNIDNGTLSSSSSGTSSATSSSATMPEGLGPFDRNTNNEIIYGEDGMPQYTLTPDTHDVRQRTIENIWDITVSLNILYKENWTKLAALEIAKFQDQLIKRLNEDAIVHLNPETIDGHSPSTEAVLLHTHFHNAHYEWDFSKAFLYSLTVLTTVDFFFHLFVCL